MSRRKDINIAFELDEEPLVAAKPSSSAAKPSSSAAKPSSSAAKPSSSAATRAPPTSAKPPTSAIKPAEEKKYRLPVKVTKQSLLEEAAKLRQRAEVEPDRTKLIELAEMKEERAKIIETIQEQKVDSTEFDMFFVDPLFQAQVKIQLYPREDSSVLKKLMKEVSISLKSIKDDDLKKIRDEFLTKRSMVNAITSQSSQNIKKLQEEFDSTIDFLRDKQREELEKIGAQAIASSSMGQESEDEDEVSDSKEEALDLSDEEAIAAMGIVKTKYSDKIDEATIENNLSISEIKSETAEKINKLNADLSELRVGKSLTLYQRLLQSNKKFSENVEALVEATLRFPGPARGDRPLSAEESNFIKSLLKTQKPVDEDEFRLISAPSKEEKLQRKRELIKQLELVQDIRSNKKSDEEDEPVIRRREERDYSDPEGAHEEFIGYDDDSEEEEEVYEDEESVDSEDEEEPQEEEIKKRHHVVKAARVMNTMSEGEKLLQGLPILEISASRYRQVYSEIDTLRSEMRMVYDLYNKLETRVVKPYLSEVKPLVDKKLILSILQTSYLNVPIDPKNWMASFQLSDEQRFILKSAQYDLSFGKMLKDTIKTVTTIDTLVRDPVVSTPEKWIEDHYDSYLQIVPRLLGKLAVIAEKYGVEQKPGTKHLLPFVQNRSQKVLLEEFAKREEYFRSDILMKHNANVVIAYNSFKEMKLSEKIVQGIPILTDLSPTSLTVYANIKSRLNKLTFSQFETKTDYPFAKIFDRIAPYVPALILRVLIHNRRQISTTRKLYFLKYILSRLSVEQYIYVKTFMAQAREQFDQLLDKIHSAYLYSLEIRDKESINIVDEIEDNEVKNILLEIVDHDFSKRVNELFTTQKSIDEYEKEFRAFVPEDRNLIKSESNFIINCRYNFRSLYNLPFFVIDSVDGMKVIQKVYRKVLSKSADGYFNPIEISLIDELLEKENEKLVDVNIEYQKDLIMAMIENAINRLIEKKMGEVIPLENEDDIVRRLDEIDRKIENMLGEERDMSLRAIDSTFINLLRHIVSKRKKTMVEKLPSTLRAMISKSVITRGSAIDKMTNRLKKRKPKVLIEEDDVDKKDEDIKKVEINEIIKNSPTTKDSLIALARASKENPKDTIINYYNHLMNHVIDLIKADQEDLTLKSDDYYYSIYEELFEKFPMILRKPGVIGIDLTHNTQKVKDQIRSTIIAAPSVGSKFVRASYALKEDSSRYYKWEDKGVLSMHPELLRIMPKIVILTQGTPFEFIRCPVARQKVTEEKAQWSYPSILFFHTIMNSDVEVKSDSLVMNNISYHLGIIEKGRSDFIDSNSNPISIRQARDADYQQLIHTIDMRPLFLILYADMVVIPSQIDQRMVFPISSEAVFYQGHERYQPQQDRIENLRLLQVELPNIKEKIQLRIEALEQGRLVQAPPPIDIDFQNRISELRSQLKSRTKELWKEASLERKAREDRGERGEKEVVDQLSLEKQTQLQSDIASIQDELEALRTKRFDNLQLYDVDFENRLVELTSMLESRTKELEEVKDEIDIFKEESPSLLKKEKQLESDIASIQDKLETLRAKRLDSLRQHLQRVESIKEEKEEVFTKTPQSVLVQIRELERLRNIQKEQFIRTNELERLYLIRQMNEQGYMRPTMNFMREVNRLGQIDESGNIKLYGVLYKCNLIKKNKLVPVDGSEIMTKIKEYYKDYLPPASPDYIPPPSPDYPPPPSPDYPPPPSPDYPPPASPDYPPPPSQDYQEVDIEDFSGTKQNECANCHKKIRNQSWGKTIYFDDEKAKIVRLCSEKCSEEYRPYK